MAIPHMYAIIIDDSAGDTNVLRTNLRETFPGMVIWPAEPAVVTRSWREAWEKIEELKRKEFDPDHAECILFLDLALGEPQRFVKEGINELKGKLPVYSKYINVIYTSSPNEANAQLGSVADATIVKEILENRRSEYLRNKIAEARDACARRNGRNASGSAGAYRIVDSVAARRMEAVFGGGPLRRLVESLTMDWANREVDALTGGYSGAFIISVSEASGAGRSYVWKLAKQRELLDNELVAFKRMMQYPEWAAVATLADSTIDQPADGTIWVMQQAAARGLTLEASIRKFDAAQVKARSQGHLNGIKRSVREVARAAVTSRINEVDVSELRMFILSSSDRDRFGASLEELRPLREQCIARGMVKKKDLVSTALLTEFQDNVVGNWSGQVARHFGRIAGAAQHGDLNPRNILVSRDDCKVIDFARFGTWPIGYDLCRLQLQLFLRCVGKDRCVDYFPQFYANGVKIGRGIFDNKLSRLEISEGVSEALEVIGREMAGLFSREIDRKYNGAKLRALSRCFDLIKMVSYADASPFRKLVFLELAVECAQSAGVL